MQRSRRASLRGCLTGVIAVLALLAWTHSAWATPPNILIIVSDDHRSQGTMETPAMQKTRGWFQTGDLPGNETVPGGTAFPNGVATTPVCCPARASIFSGRYAHNHGVRTNSDAIQLNQNTTLQHYLKQQGYRTGLFGKYLNGWASAPPDWDEYSMYEGQYFPILALEGVAGGTPTTKTILEYTTNYIGDRALQFLSQTPSGTPWLMYLAPATPHSPWMPESQYANVDVGPLQETEAYLEEDRSDKPAWARDRYVEEPGIRSQRESQLRSLYSLDDMVDRVMRAIQGTNTLAFFVGDNGWHWGEHGMDGKGSAYKESVRVPLYMRWPGSDPLNVPQDVANPALAANIDIAPTVMHAAGAPSPSVPMDGRSLIGPAPQQRSHQFLEWGSQQDTRPWEAIRTSTFTYIETGDIENWREYYDLTEDPHEVSNLLRDDDEENDPPVATLEALVAAGKVCGQPGEPACPPAVSDPATIPPDTAITAKPDARTDSTSARFVFTSSIPDSTFECALDTTSFSACPAPSEKAWPYTHKFTALSPGHHKLMVRAKSPSGVADSSHETYEWDIDATPDAVITAHPPKLTNSSSATFEFSGSGEFDCKLEEVPPQAGSWIDNCTSPKTFTNLAEGTIADLRFSVRASDSDPTPATYTWRIDTVAPTMIQPTPTFGVPNVNARLTSSEVVFTPVVNDDVRGYRCTLDNLPVRRCGGLPVGAARFRNLSNGTHSLDVTATDYAGNTSAPGHRDFTVNSAPTYSNTPELDWPELTDRLEASHVNAVIPDGSGGWFVGGNFAEIDGQARTDLARIDANGNVVAAFQATTSGEVRALKLSTDGNTLYVGGNFSSVNGDTGRSYLTAVSAQTGALTSWDPNVDGIVNDIAINGTTSAYVVGNFANVGSSPRKRVAEISLSSGNATGWGEGLNADPVSSVLSGRAVVFTTDHVYVGGEGTISQGTGGTLVSRKSLAEITRSGTGTITSWDPSPDGHTNANVQPSVEVLRVSQGSRLLVGGKFKSVSGAPTGRTSTVEYNLGDKSLGNWRAQPELGPAGTATVNALDVEEFSTPGNEDRVSILVGGLLSSVKNWYARFLVAETTKLGPEPAGVAANMGWPTDWRPEIRPTTPVYDIATSGNMVAVAGDFSAEKLNARQDLMFFRDPAPDTQWTVSPPNISSRNPTFRFSSTESHSSFECALGELEEFSPCTSPKTYQGLDVGQHHLRVRAVDSRGTPDPTPLVHNWTVQDYTTAPDTSWPWVKTGTDVRAVIPDGSGGWYVGGDFTEVCDSAHCYFREDLVHFNSNKSVDSTWDPSLQKAVGDIQATVGARALARSTTTNRLYVGGTFTQVDGNDALRRIAAINLTTGEADAGWDPDVTNHVYSLALAEDGAVPSIYVGGTLLSVGNPPQARGRIAEVRLDNAQPTSWNPNILTAGGGTFPQVMALAVTGTHVYAGGNYFGGVGMQADTGNLVKINRSDAIADSAWRPRPVGAVNTLGLRSSDSTTIHAGGTFNAVGPAVGGVQPTRRRAAEVNIAGTGTVTDWDPNVTGGAVHDLDFVDPTVFVAGAFTTVSDEPRLRLAQLHGDFGTPLGWTPDLDSTAFSLARQGSVLAVGGAFQHTVGSESHKYLAFYGPPPDE